MQRNVSTYVKMLYVVSVYVRTQCEQEVSRNKHLTVHQEDWPNLVSSCLSTAALRRASRQCPRSFFDVVGLEVKIHGLRP